MKYFSPLALTIALCNVLAASANEALSSLTVENARRTVAAYQKQAFHAHAHAHEGQSVRNLQDECSDVPLSEDYLSLEAALEFLGLIFSAMGEGSTTMDFSGAEMYISETEAECKKQGGVMYFITATYDATCEDMTDDAAMAFFNSTGTGGTNYKNMPFCTTKDCNTDALNAWFTAGGEVDCFETLQITSGVSGLVPGALAVAVGATLALVSMLIM